MFIWISQIILYHLAPEDASGQEPFEWMTWLERRPEQGAAGEGWKGNRTGPAKKVRFNSDSKLEK